MKIRKEFFVEGRWVHGYPDYAWVYDKDGKRILLADFGQSLGVIAKRIRNKIGWSWRFVKRYYSRRWEMNVLVFEREGAGRGK